MTNAYAATAQIASARRRGWIPSSTAYTTADFLASFNEEQRLFITALLKSVREEYLVNESDYDVAFAAGATLVRVPARAVGSALRAVHLLLNGEVTPLTRVEPEKQHVFSGAGEPAGYMLRGNGLRILPRPTASGTLRLSYLQRPSKIVDEADCAVISSISTVTNTVTVTAPPSGFGITALYDFVRGTPGFESLAIDQELEDFSDDEYTFASLPSELAIGDFLCLAGQSPIPQVPVELHGLLAQQVVVAFLEATGAPRLDAAKAKRDEMRADALRLLSPRVTASARPIVNPNGPGMRRRR